MDAQRKQQKAANRTVLILALVAIVIYVGFYFLMSSNT